MEVGHKKDTKNILKFNVFVIMKPVITLKSQKLNLEETYQDQINFIDGEFPFKDEIVNQEYDAKTPFSFLIDKGEEVSFSSTTRVKINIRDVGFYVFVVSSASFTKGKKNKLFDKLLSLKEIDVTKSSEELERKITSVFNFVKEHKPYFGLFVTNKFKDEIQKILIADDLISHPLFVTSEAIEETIEEDKKAVVEPVVEEELKGENEPEVENEPITENEPIVESESTTTVETEVKDEPVVESKPETTKKPKKDKKEWGQELSIKAKKALSKSSPYIFSVIYNSLLAMSSWLMFVFFNYGNNKFIGVLFLVFIILFFLLIAYNYYLKNKRLKTSRLVNVLIFIACTIAGVTIGLLAGYGIAKGLLKFETPIDFKKITTPVIVVAVVCSALTFAFAYALGPITKFIAKKKENKAKVEETKTEENAIIDEPVNSENEPIQEESKEANSDENTIQESVIEEQSDEQLDETKEEVVDEVEAQYDNALEDQPEIENEQPMEDASNEQQDENIVEPQKEDSEELIVNEKQSPTDEEVVGEPKEQNSEVIEEQPKVEDIPIINSNTNTYIPSYASLEESIEEQKEGPIDNKTDEPHEEETTEQKNEEKPIPGRFVVKTHEGYYVSEGHYSIYKSEAFVFDDFAKANDIKKEYGGKVVKL